jgi:hypothetical protein
LTVSFGSGHLAAKLSSRERDDAASRIKVEAGWNVSESVRMLLKKTLIDDRGKLIGRRVATREPAKLRLSQLDDSKGARRTEAPEPKQHLVPPSCGSRSITTLRVRRTKKVGGEACAKLVADNKTTGCESLVVRKRTEGSGRRRQSCGERRIEKRSGRNGEGHGRLEVRPDRVMSSSCAGGANVSFWPWVVKEIQFV